MTPDRERLYGEPQVIDIDTMYQDQFLNFLRTVTEPTRICFRDGKHLAQELLNAIGSTSLFYQLQKTLVFGESDTLQHFRKSLYEPQVLRQFLVDCGFHIIKVNTTDHIFTFLIEPGTDGVVVPKAEGLATNALPAHTEQFYKGKTDQQNETAKRTAALLPKPRVLNIGSGGDPHRQLPHAINGDFSPIGRPDVVFDARHLPFRDNSMTVVMASHIFEHLTHGEGLEAVREWLRVLHPKGVLRIAVPDAETTLRELSAGITRKGEPAFAIPGGSAPLTQLQGLGGEHSRTHERWRHQILFNVSLLKELVEQASGTRQIITTDYQKNEALSVLCGIKMDETNSYSLLTQFESPKDTHVAYPEVSYEEYTEKVAVFKAAHEQLKPLSIVVPIRNEASNLPAFFESLLQTTNELEKLGVQFEVIFALNGCSDTSEEIAKQFSQDHPAANAIVAKTDKGILPAFAEGVEHRRLNGHVAKLDVDTTTNSWNLPWMYMYLTEQPEKQVTYAEALPLEDTPSHFNLGEFYQQFRTERLYFHGRMSLYRENPFARFPKELILESKAKVEDVMLSCLYMYYCGIDSIGVTPGAVVKSVTLSSFENLHRNWIRTREEINNIMQAFPQFKLLSSMMKREATLPPEELKQEDPELYSMWKFYNNLHNAMQELIKSQRLSPSELQPHGEWSIRHNTSH